MVNTTDVSDATNQAIGPGIVKSCGRLAPITTAIIDNQTTHTEHHDIKEVPITSNKELLQIPHIVILNTSSLKMVPR